MADMAKSSWRPKKQARQNRVLNFSWSFRFFPLNKSSNQNTETKQTKPQLHFALKIIKNHLAVLENELVEVCSLILKKCKAVCQNFICVFIANSWRRALNEHYVDTLNASVFFSIFFSSNQHANFNQLVLQNYQTFFDDFWCKMKLGSCLSRFSVLFTTFV